LRFPECLWYCALSDIIKARQGLAFMALSDWTDKLKAVFHRTASALAVDNDLAADERETSHTDSPTTLKEFTNTVVKFSKPYWTSAERGTGFKLLGGVLGFTGLEVLISLEINNFIQDFTNALFEHDKGELALQSAKFGLLAYLSKKVTPQTEYRSTALRIHWREWQTKQMIDEKNPNSYMANDNFYHLKTMKRFKEYLEKDTLDEHDDKTLKNINQRIGEDIKAAVDKTVWMGQGLIRAAADISVFSARLYYGVNGGGWLALAALAYAAGGAKVMQHITAPLKRLNDKHQGLESTFREKIFKVGENAEQVALLDGAPVESERLRDDFKNVVKNSWGLNERNKQFKEADTLYNVMARALPLFLLIPPVLKGEANYGQVASCVEAFKHVLDSMNWFVNGQPFFRETEATTNRVNELSDMNAAPKTVQNPQQNAPAA
jgi:putative ATP-binding cassette transporter